MKLQSPSLSLRTKLIALTGSMAVGFIWMLAYVSATVLHERMVTVLSDQQFANTRKAAQELDTKFQADIHGLQRIAATLPNALTFASLQPILEQQQLLQVLFSGGASVIGLDGIVIADYPVAPGRRHMNVSDRDYVRKVLETGKPYIDKPTIGRALKRPVIIMGVPVLDSAGKVRAVMAGVTDLTVPGLLGFVNDPLQTGKGQYYVFSLRDRIIVAATDAKRTMTAMPAPGVNPVLDRMVAGFEGSAVGVSSEGIEKLFSGSHVAATDWLIINTLATQFAFDPISALKHTLYWAASLITLVAFLVIYFVIGKATTEHRRAEMALRESEQRFRLMANAAPVLIWVTGAENQREWFNQRWLDFTGRSMAESTGPAWTDSIYPADLGLFLSTYNNSFQRRAAFEIEYRMRNARGECCWMLARGVPRLDAEGEFLGFISCCTEITAQKAAEKLMGQEKDAAKAATQAKSAFIANMSHEIRTPMNAILGSAHLMRRDGVTAQQRVQLDRIDVASEHLLAIINNILDLSKIEAGKLVLEDTDFTVSNILNRVVSILSYQVKEKDLRLMMDVEYLPQVLRGDATRLAQALLNYTNNAVKFTDRGTITIRARLLKDTATQQQLRFEVEDTGLGVEEEQMKRLFTAFEQADNSTTREYGGTGLGLAITKKLATLMDGDAGGSSVPGVGSTFWLTVTLRKSPSNQLASALTTDIQNLESCLFNEFRGRKILLAEDDPTNQFIVLELLRDTGLLVEFADNGAEAVEKARHTRYELILMDMQMPKMNGLDAARTIRTFANGVQVPILAMTANAFTEDRQRCIAAGMSDFLSKPVVPGDLLATLLRWLRQPVANTAHTV